MVEVDETGAADANTPKPAVFVDRDGTLNRLIPYLYRPDEFEWVPGVPEAIKRLNDVGILVIVVTNQAGVARGYFTIEDVEKLHEHMAADLEDQTGGRFDAVYYCPYHPDGVVEEFAHGSWDRKPSPGMFERGMAEFRIDRSRSFVVGDRNDDLDAGRAVGLSTVLVETGYGEEEKDETEADAVVRDLPTAVEHILTELGLD